LCRARRHRRYSLLGGWCRGVGTTANIVALVGVRVCVSGGSGGLKNTRSIEGTQQFILVRADRCPTSSSWWFLYSRAPKIGGYNRVYRRKREIW
jgi:hypothetical protein